MGVRRRSRNGLPVLYLLGALLGVIAVLPTALRPPPDEANQSAELSPDAPPDQDPDAIIQSLKQAGSRTAGATGDEKAAPTTTTTAAPPPQGAAQGQCYGSPPRQFDSIYAPPCRAAFTGDNGGSTWRGVTATEIKIGLSPDLTGLRDCGQIPEAPEPGETGATRTYRVLRDFFNQNLVLSGRRMTWYFSCAPNGSVGEPAERARGTALATTYGVFASIGEYSAAVAEEATRRGVIHFSNLVVEPDEFYAARQPNLWGSRTNATKAVEFGSTYLCRKLAGNKPFATGDNLIDYTKPRTFGILALDDKNTHGAVVDMQAKMKAKCGATAIVASYTLDEDNAQGLATAWTKLRSANVSTVVFMGEILSLSIHTQIADQHSYFPEWYLMGFGGFETSIQLTRTASPRQWRNAFGFSFEEIPLRPLETPCYRAYKSMDPANNPDDSICNVLFHSMTFLTGAIQEAGADLNPTTFKNALYHAATRDRSPWWAMSGSFGPGDYTYGDYAVELWWDPDATHPDGLPGAYVYPRCGQRFSLSEITSGNPSHMFQRQPTSVTYGFDAKPGC